MKKIFKCFGSIALALCIALGSFFIPKNLSKTQRVLGTSLETAGAYNFVSNDEFLTSNFLFPPLSFKSSNFFYSTNDPDLEYIDLGFNNDLQYQTRVMLNFKIVRVPLNYGVRYELYVIFSDNQYSNLNYQLCGTYSYLFSGSGSGGAYSSSVQGVQMGSYYIPFVFNVEHDFSDKMSSLDFQMCEIGTSLDYSYSVPVFLNDVNFNYISYVDSLGYIFTIYFPRNSLPSFTDSTRWFSYRRYFLNSDFEFTNNGFYNQGYANGVQNGISQGQQEGYQSGFNQGKIEGYNNGYSQGLESSGRLGFPALISSVIDVPVKVFTSLFNFDILGVNILTFITTLLTIALILAIVRKVKSD